MTEYRSGATETSPATFEPGLEEFRDDILAGLTSDPKETSPKYLYDERG
jgi:uncharacterized SAM-dependent methyltransferase